MLPRSTGFSPDPSLELLLDHKSRPIHLNDRHLRAGLEHSRVTGSAAPVFAFHFYPARKPRADAFGHDPRLAEQRVHAGAELRPGAELEVVHEPRPQSRHAGNAGEREREALGHKAKTGDQSHDASDRSPDRQTSQPEAGREHLSHEQRDGQQKPKQPTLHIVKAATLVLIALSNVSQLLVEPL